MTTKKRLTLKDLEALGGFVDLTKPKKRGRNAPRTAYEMDKSKDGQRTTAVARQISLLGGGRGSEAEAIRLVAKADPRYKPDLAPYLENQIKSSLKRYKKSHDWAAKVAAVAGIDRFFSNHEELTRRCSGFPDDVREKVYRWSADALLAYLRENDIDGTCPKEFLDFVRSM